MREGCSKLSGFYFFIVEAGFLNGCKHFELQDMCQLPFLILMILVSFQMNNFIKR